MRRSPTIDVFLTMYQHPAMLRLVIESINKARKPRNYRVWGVFEHGFEPVLERMFDELEGVEKKKMKRQVKHGINWNTPRTYVQMGERTEGEYVVQLQSDIVLSTDFFEWADYVHTNFDVGYAMGFGIPNDRPRDDAAIAIKCTPGWYGHWGNSVRSDVLREIYPKYITEEYKKKPDKHVKAIFPKIRAVGSDFFINAFLHKEGVCGARPLSSRVTNVGIDGEHIRIKDKKKWNRLSHEEKVRILRRIVDEGVYEYQSNYKLHGIPRVLGEYEWDSLHEVEVESKQKHTGTDL